MRRTSAYIISFCATLTCLPAVCQNSEVPIDTVEVPLKVRTALEISGPLLYFTDRNILNLEASVTIDLDEKKSLYLGSGWSDYSYSQYNYSFLANGVFAKAGVDFNLLRSEMTEGKYWAGGGLHYGLSRFSSETPFMEHNNYWSSVSSSLPEQKYWCHFFEISGGFKAEVFRNFSIGWLVSVRKLLYTGAEKELRPIYYPGYGDGGKTLTYGLSYYISFNIPFKKIKVFIMPEPVEEPEDDEENQTGPVNQPGRQGMGNLSY